MSRPQLNRDARADLNRTQHQTRAGSVGRLQRWKPSTAPGCREHRCYLGITAGSVIKMSLIKDVLIHLAGVNQNVRRVPARRRQSTLFNEQSLLPAALRFHTAKDQHICLRALKRNCWWHKRIVGEQRRGVGSGGSGGRWRTAYPSLSETSAAA